MDNLPYERAALNGEPMPDGLTLEDQLCFQALALLYRRYRAGSVSKNVGAEEAWKIRSSCQVRKEALAFERKCNSHSVRLWKAVEGAANAYQKERTLENADRMIEAIYGVGIPREES
jgi:hypothetical protein